MENLSKAVIQSLSKKIGFYPQRSAGQNFLANKSILEEIIVAADLKNDDLVLEIGPGFGFLTHEICQRVKKVVAVELDRRLADYLKIIFKHQKNIEVLKADIFKVNLSQYFKDLNYRLISNLPYNITSLVLRNYLTLPPRPKEMILTLQKEVARRIMAKPGEMSLLAVFCQYYSSPESILKFGRENFWPCPEVDSVLMKFSKIGEKKLAVEEKAFIHLVKAGFSAKRKKLTNNLKNSLGISSEISEKALKSLGLEPAVRAQEISLENWVNLAHKFL